MPVKDEQGNCVNFIQKIPSYYKHYYKYEGGLDLSFLNRHDSIVLNCLNEYSIEIYKKVIPCWSGKNIYLVGSEWKDYLAILPPLPNVSVRHFNGLTDMASAIKSQKEEQLLYI